MTFLLDTHTLLWALGDPDRLGPRAREVLDDRTTEVLTSPVTAWELATKHRLGKLPHAEPILANYRRNLERLGISSCTVTDDHALLAGSLPWENRDPFDRMLAAQVLTEGWIIVTRDRSFGELPGVRALW